MSSLIYSEKFEGMLFHSKSSDDLMFICGGGLFSYLSNRDFSREISYDDNDTRWNNGEDLVEFGWATCERYRALPRELL